MSAEYDAREAIRGLRDGYVYTYWREADAKGEYPGQNVLGMPRSY